VMGPRAWELGGWMSDTGIDGHKGMDPSLRAGALKALSVDYSPSRCGSAPTGAPHGSDERSSL
jgi:hypothetical protein